MASTISRPIRHSLPSRASNRQSATLSLSDYQPLAFDRDSLESSYQQSQGLYSNSSFSSEAHLSGSFGGSTESSSGPSTLSQHLRAGDNPNLKWSPSQNNFAGVGAGHTITPPGSPSPPHHRLFTPPTPPTIHRPSILSPVPASPTPPNLPPRPFAIPESTLPVSQGEYDSMAMDIDGDAGTFGQRNGSDSDVGSISNVRQGKKRALPELPQNVPVPEPPAWQPDLKTTIPPQLVAASVQNAYAQLSAPPPNLPPRRTQPARQASHPRPSYNAVSSFRSRRSSRPRPATMVSQSTIGTLPNFPLPPGAPSFPNGPVDTQAIAPVKAPRPAAEKEVYLNAEGPTPIWSTHYLDPSLSTSTVLLPPAEPNASNKRKRLDGLAKMAERWVVPADAKFHSEGGMIDVGLGIIDQGGEGWGREKGRKRARVEVGSKNGGVRVDLIEMDENRQVELKVETKTGDVLLLLPETFHGQVFVTSPARPPTFLALLSSQMKPVQTPFTGHYTTLIQSSSPYGAQPIELDTAQPGLAGRLGRHSERLSAAVSGYANPKDDESVLRITTQKGRVVLGRREGGDEEASRTLGLRVGVNGGGRRGKKGWWRG
ncbi:hypothetical protein P7C73_g2170, partial [Tremellales sp. Uapishka_1]